MSSTPNRAKDNPKLRERAISDGKKSLYLEYYISSTRTPKMDAQGNQMFYATGKMAGKPMYEIKHHRRKEELKLYLYAKPRTAEEKVHNKNALTKAQQIRNEREQEFLTRTMGYSISRNSDNLMPCFESYVETYTKQDIRNIRLALNRFKDFLRANYPACVMPKTDRECECIRMEWEERHAGVYGRHEINPNEFYLFRLNPRQFTEGMVREFVSYLQEHSTGSGAATAFERFKKIVRNVAKSGYMAVNPCEDVVCKRNECFSKEILSADEIRALQRTHMHGENPNIRRAFLFTLYTGVRWCDVKELRFANIDYQNRTLKFEQAKTRGHSAHSVVEMPIMEEVLLHIVGRPEDQGKSPGDLIFSLPSHTMCLKSLRRWCKNAGIEKHITWHCGRHSFATNLLENGANVKTVADLLGHSGLEYVERYVHAIDESKRRALESLPKLEI